MATLSTRQVAKLQSRCFQPTRTLMREVGNVTETPDGLYAFRDWGSNVLAVAHCDSVTCGSSHYRTSHGITHCTRLDDRLGVFALLDYLPKMGVRCDILLTDNEEVGRSTAKWFETEKRYNWLLEIDRRGVDAVVYDYESPEWCEALTSQFTLGWGSFSDICYLDHLGVCGVNVGCGYYGEHTMQSHAVHKHFIAQMKRVAAFYAAHAGLRFEAPVAEPSAFSLASGWHDESQWGRYTWGGDYADDASAFLDALEMYAWDRIDRAGYVDHRADDLYVTWAQDRLAIELANSPYPLIEVDSESQVDDAIARLLEWL